MDEATLANWLTERLTGDRAREDWRRLVEAGWGRITEQKLSAVLPPAEVEALASAYLTPERILVVVLPVVRGVVAPAVHEARRDHAKLGRWVPASARSEIDAIVARKGVVHPSFIQTLFRQEAIEALVNDTLYSALRDFSTIVPRLIQNISPIGKLAKLGGFGDKGGLGSRVVEEVEKRLEPEIRRFLEAGTRRALDGAARFAVDHLDDPTSVKLRRNMVTFVLEQEVAFHVQAVGDDVLEAIERATVAISRHVAESPEARVLLRDAVARIAREQGERPIGEVLAELGVTGAPPFDAWAQVTFPAVAAVIRAPGVEAWLVELCRELLAEVQRSPGSA